MKKLLTLTLALTMALCMLALCASCTAETTDAPDENSPEATPSAPASTPEEQSKPAALPEGYTLYENGDLSFAYPEAFTKTDGSTVILSDATNGNNITVVYEVKTDAYESLTTEKYNEVYIPVYAEMGLTVTNATVAHTSHNGTKLTTITQTTKTESATMDQTLYVLTIGDKTYTVTVTEVVDNAELVSTVLETLTVLK